MYCASCGANLANNLIYCNHCGAKLSEEKADGGKAAELSPNLLLCAIVITFVIGMAVIITLLSAMKKPGFDESMVTALMMFSIFLLLTLEGVFFWLLLSRTKLKKQVSGTNKLGEQQRREIYSTPARAITEPVSSVIEQTTNRLEPIFRDEKSR